jgi:hypothetical protein
MNYYYYYYYTFWTIINIHLWLPEPEIITVFQNVQNAGSLTLPGSAGWTDFNWVNKVAMAIPLT